MAEAPKWLKGQLVGNCLGKPTRRAAGTGLARWYKLTLVDAVISDWAPVAGPPAPKPEQTAPFCQATLRDARLRSRSPGGDDEELSLREVSVWDWKMRDHREAGGESRCTLVGTVYAREVEGTRRPALADGADRLDRWGCLALVAALLVGFWLWWRCGPFTCGLWASVIAASWWTRRARTRRRSPPRVASQLLQGVLALLLIAGGVAVAFALRDPARAATCTDVSGLAVLLGLDLVIAASLLTVRWPLPWVWVTWTAIVALWCGRAGADCADVWLKRAREAAVGTAPAPKPTALPGPTAVSSEDGGSTKAGAGSGARAGSDGGGGDTSGGEPGDQREPKGTGSSEWTRPRGTGGIDDEGFGGGGTRMTVEEALGDPRPFLEGSKSVTLSGDLLFDFDEDTLRPAAEPRLKQLAQLLRLQPQTHVLLEGHADTIGGDQYNQTLSERRAEAVRAWLVEKAHFSPLQLDTVGFGNSMPVVPASASPAAQRANRRVEVKVLP